MSIYQIDEIIMFRTYYLRQAGVQTEGDTYFS